MNIFNYTTPTIPDNCFNISPSQLGKFFSDPKEWYLANIKGEQQFFGSTSAALGTVCHYIYEQVTLGNKVNKTELDKQIDEYALNNTIVEIDSETIKSLYPQITSVVVNGYILPANKKGARIECEKQVSVPFRDNIYISGTIDRIEGDCIVDFKTVSTKPSTDSIPDYYLLQLLTYAYIARKLGYEINRIRLVYGVRPTKTLPARYFIVNQVIDSDLDKLIINTLNLVADTILEVQKNPKLTYLLFKSYDLKE